MIHSHFHIKLSICCHSLEITSSRRNPNLYGTDSAGFRTPRCRAKLMVTYRSHIRCTQIMEKKQSLKCVMTFSLPLGKAGLIYKRISFYKTHTISCCFWVLLPSSGCRHIMDIQYNYSLDTEIEEEVRPRVEVGTERLISRGQKWLGEIT